jgi:hypothetical protein
VSGTSFHMTSAESTLQLSLCRDPFVTAFDFVCISLSIYKYCVILSFGLGDGPAVFALPKIFIVHPSLDNGLELCAEISDMERLLIDYCGLFVCPRFAVPAKPV